MYSWILTIGCEEHVTSSHIYTQQAHLYCTAQMKFIHSSQQCISRALHSHIICLIRLRGGECKWKLSIKCTFVSLSSALSLVIHARSGRIRGTKHTRERGGDRGLSISHRQLCSRKTNLGEPFSRNGREPCTFFWRWRPEEALSFAFGLLAKSGAWNYQCKHGFSSLLTSGTFSTISVQLRVSVFVDAEVDWTTLSLSVITQWLEG